MDPRLVLLGTVANIGLILLSIESFQTANEIILYLVALFGTSVILSIIGLSKKGIATSDANGGILFGSMVVWALGLWGFGGSWIGYEESLPFCQEYASGYVGALDRCTQGQGYLEIMALMISCFVVTAVTTSVALFNLRRLSEKT